MKRNIILIFLSLIFFSAPATANMGAPAVAGYYIGSTILLLVIALIEALILFLRLKKYKDIYKFKDFLKVVFIANVITTIMGLLVSFPLAPLMGFDIIFLIPMYFLTVHVELRTYKKRLNQIDADTLKKHCYIVNLYTYALLAIWAVMVSGLARSYGAGAVECVDCLIQQDQVGLIVYFIILMPILVFLFFKFKGYKAFTGLFKNNNG